MTDVIFALVLLLLALGGVVVRKTYFAVPIHELKRQAEKHEPVAFKLYPAAAYGSSLRRLLWIFIALTMAGGVVVLARQAPVWLSLLVVVVLLWVAFSWLPHSRAGKFGRTLAVFVTPGVTWLLHYVHPLLSRGADTIEQHLSAGGHTGIFERDDLVRLIERQQWQADSRLSEEELEIAKRALSFDEHTVADILMPRGAIKTILADDAVGPILIDELHKAGQDAVLVRDKPKGAIVGTLAFKRLGLESRGKVRDIMDATVYYLHENDSLSEALHAFFVTNHPLFVVVNSFEEYVGIISVEDMLQQLLGHVPGDDFDQYADPAAVAARHQK